jgi:hypothetical protein
MFSCLIGTIFKKAVPVQIVMKKNDSNGIYSQIDPESSSKFDVLQSKASDTQNSLRRTKPFN